MGRRGRDPSRRGNPVVGILVGGFGGFLTYWVGAFLAAAQDLMAQSPDTLPMTFARPFLTFTAWEVSLAAAGALLGLLVARYRWRLAGVTGYIGLLSLIVGYVAYSITVSIPAVPADQRWVSWALLGAEAGGLVLILVFAFYSLDAATRRRWARVARTSPFDSSLRPKVAFQVPVFNEPFEMVRQTVLHLTRQDYPRDRFTIMVADDSTDPSTSAPLRRLCQEVGATYVRSEEHTSE